MSGAQVMGHYRGRDNLKRKRRITRRQRPAEVMRIMKLAFSHILSGRVGKSSIVHDLLCGRDR